ncbi:ABC transporter permease [Paenibacillus eucommiae]|uniref:Spermidine/putrescine transport system permease protein n=1 Tax=Paenibacillus eucommiae TaxID=1355755 RepID=A0ABS4J9K4_9BACL|nr:ABC transporter permease [Paenibacillus eucommiae]MBP1995399.1 putative spermidine/putrescine transport system permease protein [Paenibacillus eucommiae]
MWLLIVVAIILILIVVPILIVIPLSFSSSSFITFPPPGYSLQWYQKIFEQDAWIEAIIRSLEIAVGCVILSLILGTMAALAMTRLQFKGKNVVMALMLSPMIIPTVILGIAMYRFYSITHLYNTPLGLLFAHTLIALPMVFITVSTSLRGVDRNLELAAIGMGSTPVGAFFKIGLSLIKPGLLSGGLFAFVTSLDEITVTLFIGGSKSTTLPKLMWEGMQSETSPIISAVSALLIACTSLLFVIQAFSSRRKKNKNSLAA